MDVDPPNWPRGPELLDQLTARRNQELMELKMAEMFAPELLTKMAEMFAPELLTKIKKHKHYRPLQFFINIRKPEQI